MPKYMSCALGINVPTRIVRLCLSLCTIAFVCCILAPLIYSVIMGASMGRQRVGSPGNAVCVVCDDCGCVFAIANAIVAGTDKKKRCER